MWYPAEFVEDNGEDVPFCSDASFADDPIFDKLLEETNKRIKKQKRTNNRYKKNRCLYCKTNFARKETADRHVDGIENSTENREPKCQLRIQQEPNLNCKARKRPVAINRDIFLMMMQ